MAVGSVDARARVMAWLGAVAVLAGTVGACTSTVIVTREVDPACGDGFVDEGEACDDGNGDNNDPCTAACRRNVCGDGLVDVTTEDCDDGGESAECTAKCQNWHDDPFDCGNGLVDPGEDCDPWGPGQTKKNTPTCDTDCTAPSCDDEILNLGAGECCVDSAEFPCDDFPELLEKKENGDRNWCLCDIGVGGSGAGGCDEPFGITLAGFVVNETTPTSSAPGNGGTGVDSVWAYGGELGLQAGHDLCAQIGGDHVCEWDEVVEANEDGELESLLPAAQAFWIHRELSNVTIADLGTVSVPGPGGRCSDWTSAEPSSYDAEVGIYQPSGTPGAGWQQVDGYLWAKFDQDTSTPGTGSYDGLACGTDGPPATSNGVLAILCCFPHC